MLKLRIIKQMDGIGGQRYLLQEEKHEQSDGEYWDWAKTPNTFDDLELAVTEAEKRLKTSWGTMTGSEVVWDSEEARQKVLDKNNG